MFFGYCFPRKDGWHTPKVTLRDAEAVFRYCALQHVFFEEIRITDEGDFLVAHVLDHVCKVPQADAAFTYYDLNANGREMPVAEGQERCQ